MLDELKEEIRNYYGFLNEAMVLKNNTLPRKPQALINYELVKKSPIPLIAGGIMDQPYIWSLQFEVIEAEVNLHETIKRVAAQNAGNIK